jgi:hypothetical protein
MEGDVGFVMGQADPKMKEGMTKKGSHARSEKYSGPSWHGSNSVMGDFGNHHDILLLDGWSHVCWRLGTN